MKSLALLAIRGYQRWISPYKGFGCAYRGWCGGASCSMLGLRAIRRYGVWQGLQVLDARLQQCGRANEALRERRWRPRAQAGDCDCGGCDLPGADGCDLPGKGKACDFCNLCDVCDCCDCDWRRKDKRTPAERKRRGSRDARAGSMGRERPLPPHRSRVEPSQPPPPASRSADKELPR